MADYIPNSDALMRSTLRDTIKRLRRIRIKAGAKDEEEEQKSTGDPFTDLAMAFIKLVTCTKDEITERNQGAREHGQDRMCIEQTNQIRKNIRQMEATLEDMKQLVDKSEALFKRESQKKHPKKTKQDLLERNYNERRSQYADCQATLQVVKEMDSERMGVGKKGISPIKETQFGKKAHLREQLLGMRRKSNLDGGSVDPNKGLEYVDNTVGGGRLEDDVETKELTKVIAQQDAKINAGLDRIKEGVGRLHSIAQDIGAQLDMQNEMLDKTELTVDKQTKQLYSLNRRIGKLIKQQKPMNCFFNMCCVVIIIALVGFFLIQFNVI